MIEISLHLKLDSFLVNSMGKSEDTTGQNSSRALKLTCEQVASGRLMVESKPTVDFEFMAATSTAQIEGDKEFDSQFLTYLKSHTAIQNSKVKISSGSSGYVGAGKGGSSGEIGRLYIADQSTQSSLQIELVFKPEEFDAAWELMTKEKIRKVTATLVCFKLMPGAFVAHTENKFAAGILSCLLQLPPNN
jgi:hypothetical protein